MDFKKLSEAVRMELYAQHVEVRDCDDHVLFFAYHEDDSYVWDVPRLTLMGATGFEQLNVVVDKFRKSFIRLGC